MPCAFPTCAVVAVGCPGLITDGHHFVQVVAYAGLLIVSDKVPQQELHIIISGSWAPRGSQNCTQAGGTRGKEGGVGAGRPAVGGFVGSVKAAWRHLCGGEARGHVEA
jgi:hypothetical protein